MLLSLPRKQLFILVAFVALLLIPVAVQAQAAGQREVPEGTAPTLDGLISPGEWDDALKIEGALPWQAIYFKHDSANLYVTAQAKGNIEEFFLGFDTNGNGVAFDAGDDIKRCLSGVCEDWFYTDDYLFKLDEQQDAYGIGFYDEGTDTYTYEMATPIESADPEGADPDIGAEGYVMVTPGIVLEGEEYMMPSQEITTKPATAAPKPPAAPKAPPKPAAPETTPKVPQWLLWAGAGLGAALGLAGLAARKKERKENQAP